MPHVYTPTKIDQYDLRVLEQKLQNGEIKKADYEKYLKSLSDDSANAQTIHPLEIDQPQQALLEGEEA